MNVFVIKTIIVHGITYKGMKITTRHLEKAVIDYTFKDPIQSLRTYIDDEWDVCTINRTDYATQWELKASKSDFKADFKKPKHKKFSKWIGGNTRRFFFVCPYGMIDLKDIPKYAGLAYVDKRGVLVIIKKAPLLKANKISQAQKNKLFISIMHRWLKKEFKDL